MENTELKKEYNNVLIITTSGDNSGCSVSFIKSTDEIEDTILKRMILTAIEELTWEDEKGDCWSYNGDCGSETKGYIFDDFKMPDLPITINHIVNYLI